MCCKEQYKAGTASRPLNGSHWPSGLAEVTVSSIATHSKLTWSVYIHQSCKWSFLTLTAVHERVSGSFFQTWQIQILRREQRPRRHHVAGMLLFRLLVSNRRGSKGWLFYSINCIMLTGMPSWAEPCWPDRCKAFIPMCLASLGPSFDYFCGICKRLMCDRF